MAGEGEYKFPLAATVRDATDILNSLLATAKIDVRVIEISICKEEVTIGYPQVETYESELAEVDKRDGIERGARYLAAAVVATEGRQVQVYTRFYLTSDGSAKIEQCHADNVTIVQNEEAKKPDLWRGALEAAERWGPTIVNIILSLLGHPQR